MSNYMSLGDIISSAKVERCGNGIYPVLSMTMHNGIILQNDRFKKSLASLDQSNYKVVKKGQLVVGFPIDEGVLYVQKVVSEGIMSPAYNIWNIKNEIVDEDYLELCLHSPQAMQFYKANLRGTTARRRSIPTGTLLSLKIPVPSLDNQRKIVALISNMETLITKHNLQLTSLDELVKSRFLELFGDEKHRMMMSEVCSIITDGTHQPPKFKREGIPFIFVSNIAEDRLTYNAEKFIDQETYDELIKRTPIEIGDVLLSTVGSYGHPAVVKSDKKFLFQRHIAYLKPRREIVDSEFLHGAILSSDVQGQIEKAVKGIAQKTLNLSEIKKMLIPVPTMDMQKQFATFVAQVDKSKYCRGKSRRLLQRVASI